MTMTTYFRAGAGIGLMLLVLLASGCAGVRTFPNTVRAGDTAAIALGWKQDFSRQDVIVTITDANGAETVYGPGDPAVRAIINFYPDPLSGMLVADGSGVELTPAAATYARMINNQFTAQDRNWWQTVAFIDLPGTLASGPAEIAVANAAGASAASTVEVLGQGGSAGVFDSEVNGPLTPQQMWSMERVPHYEVSFTGSLVPYAVELRFTHAPDVDNGGQGRAYPVNPRGELKNLLWSSDGTALHVIMTPTSSSGIARLKDFSFYVAGGVTGLQLVSVAAYDANGNTVEGIGASVRARR